MCTCFGASSVSHREFSRKDDLEVLEEPVSLSVSKRIKDISVRIVHAGGRIEMYQNAVPASKLIKKYPGMCIAKPDVFKRPHESTLSSDDILLPGNKYYIVRCTTVEKLKRKKSGKGVIKESRRSESSDKPPPSVLKVVDIGDFEHPRPEEPVCSATDFIVLKNRWSECSLKNQVKQKKEFKPPIPRPRIYREPEWEPSLTSIRELSP